MTQREPQDPTRRELDLAAARAGSKHALAKALGIAPETLSRQQLSEKTMGKVRRYMAEPEQPDPVDALLDAAVDVVALMWPREQVMPAAYVRAIARLAIARDRLLSARGR